MSIHYNNYLRVFLLFFMYMYQQHTPIRLIIERPFR